MVGNLEERFPRDEAHLIRRAKQIKNSVIWRPSPEVIKHVSCSTQLSTKFQQLLKAKMPTNKNCTVLNPSDVVFITLINVKMPTIDGVLTFMSRINFELS